MAGTLESFPFEVRLVDAVTATAKRSTEAVKGLKNTADKTKVALDFSKELKRVEDSLKKINQDPAGYKKLKQAQKELRDTQKKITTEHKSFSQGLFSWATPYGGGRVGAHVVGELMADGIMEAGKFLVESAMKAAEVLAEGISKAFEEAAKQQTLRLGERLSLGKGAGEYREDVGRFSKLTGFNEDVIRKQLLPLRRSGFSQDSARQAYATAADIAAGQGNGGDAGAVSSTLDVFKHIKTKGGITKKMMVELLGDAGSTIPDFYKNLGKELKTSAKTAEKMAEEGGKIDPQLIMNMITESVNKMQGGKAGTGAIAYSKTFEARLEKVKNLPNEYLKNLVESPNFERASDMLGGILDKLDPESPTGRRIMASIDSMFIKITDFIGDPDRAAEALANGIEQTIDLVEKLVPDLEVVGSLFVRAAESAADMARMLRVAQAYARFDKVEIAAIKQEDQDKYDAQVQKNSERQIDAQIRSLTSNALASGLVNSMNPMAAVTNAMVVSSAANEARNKVIHVNAPVNVTINGADADAAKKVGAEVHRAATTAHEQAAQEGG